MSFSKYLFDLPRSCFFWIIILTTFTIGYENLLSIIKQIETAMGFSNARKVPYTPEQVVTTAYALIFATG